MHASLPKRPLSPTLAAASELPQSSRPKTAPGAPAVDVDASRSSTTFLPLPSLLSPAPRTPAFQQPTPLASYSMHAPPPSKRRRTQVFDDSALGRFKTPPMGCDLGEGYERVTWRKEGWEGGGVREGVDGLVECIRRVERDKGKILAKGKEGIITWRGVITKLLTSPYEERDSWEMNAMALDGNVYLELHKTPEAQSNRNGSNPQAKLFSYYGYAFESYCTEPPPASSTSSPTPKAQNACSPAPGFSSDVDTNDEWCVVVKTALAGVRLIIGGEVDCVRGDYDGTLRNSIELKTNMVIGSPNDERNFTKKLLKHWAQSFLLGIPSIVVGFRQRQPPLIRQLQTFQTLQIPRMVRGQPGGWEPAVSLAFAGEALTFLRKTVVEQVDEGEEERPRVWRLSFDALERRERGLRLRELEREEVAELETGRDEEEEGSGRWGFLPGWMKKA